MNLKLLFVISNDEKTLNRLINKFSLPFNTLMHGDGTASQGILDFLGLHKTRKNILMSIISSYDEENIEKFIREESRIPEIGKGVAFATPLSSSPKYIEEAYKERVGDNMKKKSLYHLIITIVKEGNAEKVMNAAKKNGANGGTLLKGRGIGGKNSFKFFNMTVEPEKDVILIVCKDDDKNKIMKAILDKNGANTDSQGICFSLPIDMTIGIDE